MKDIFIIGSKGIPAAYGGFESFVDNLVQKKQSKDIRYHVACMNSEQKEFTYRGAHCFSVTVPPIGPAKAVYYDLVAFQYCLSYIKNHKCKAPIVYVLACRIGPFVGAFKRKLVKLGGSLFVNPDGHEWLRSKWNALIKKYWKVSECYMVKHADLLICDSQHIEKYILQEYAKYQPSTTYIAYGADVKEEKTVSDDENKIFDDWAKAHGIMSGQYYLIVGRFVPENNYKLMISEFMKSDTKCDLVIITNVEKNKFYQQLQHVTDFESDARIKFVGTVYNQGLLRCIRENATAYVHGHAVGGTNPSLLEALASTKVNVLYDVGFNREVAEDAALYFSESGEGLEACIKKIDLMTESERKIWGEKAKGRIAEAFSHEYITAAYEQIFIREN